MHQLPTSTPFLDAMIVGPVGWIAFNRPSRRNAITSEMWLALTATVKLLDERPDVRVICIRGAGHEAFASGADISEFAEERNNAAAARADEKLNADAFAAIRTAGKPVIAMIEGYCIGGGLAVALACDVRVAGHGTVFALPPARLGLAYPLDGLRDLLTAVGLSAAKELLFTARRIGPHEALRIGLVDRVTEHPEHAVRRNRGVRAAVDPARQAGPRCTGHANRPCGRGSNRRPCDALFRQHRLRRRPRRIRREAQTEIQRALKSGTGAVASLRHCVIPLTDLQSFRRIFQVSGTTA
jgi:enoyl-CoA hydratase/carnithine racemase